MRAVSCNRLFPVPLLAVPVAAVLVVAGGPAMSASLPVPAAADGTPSPLLVRVQASGVAGEEIRRALEREGRAVQAPGEQAQEDPALSPDFARRLRRLSSEETPDAALPPGKGNEVLGVAYDESMDDVPVTRMRPLRVSPSRAGRGGGGRAHSSLATLHGEHRADELSGLASRIAGTIPEDYTSLPLSVGGEGAGDPGRAISLTSRRPADPADTPAPGPFTTAGSAGGQPSGPPASGSPSADRLVPGAYLASYTGQEEAERGRAMLTGRFGLLDRPVEIVRQHRDGRDWHSLVVPFRSGEDADGFCSWLRSQGWIFCHPQTAAGPGAPGVPGVR